MRESLIEEKFTQWCAKSGLLTYKFTSPSNRGVPDRIVLGNGRCLFVEFKAPGKRATALQEREHDRIRKSGNLVLVFDDAELAIRHVGAIIFR